MTTLRAIFKTMRPKQWTKNVVVYAALVFDGKFLELPLFLKTTALFALFCLISSSVYLLNDLADIEKDRQHPQKRHRPLASGELQPRYAVFATIVLVLFSLPAAWLLDPLAGLFLAAYFVMNVAYSFWLKHMVILDVFTIAAGFVLRVAAGAAVVQVERFSPWLYVCITLLALIIALGKRRAELVALEGDAGNHRAILDEYNLNFLDHLISLTTGATVVAYSLYTFSAQNLPENHLMMLTIPIVIYFLFRYLYLIHVRQLGGAPDELIFKDKPLFFSAAFWALAVVVILYVSNYHP
ncbi:MAG TPA: decaprenyl-phosphate phosphoribosyltransferase [Anaerolineae bacterium]|nr:decaprenyl-phosphate phosphoribosyltransferase [Anaerolineae bacterium]